MNQLRHVSPSMSSATGPKWTGSERSRRGLTLLEMLLVVFILSAVALGAVSLTDKVDSQGRFDDTSRRLNLLRDAIVGPRQFTSAGQRINSGFVNDLGTLPASVSRLTLTLSDSQTTIPRFQAHAPLFFDPTVDAPGTAYGPYSWDTTSNSDAVPVSGTILYKGYRGPYLALDAGATSLVDSLTPPNVVTLFRDGWGTHSASDDALNFGWLWTAPTAMSVAPYSSPLLITSLGADGVVTSVTTGNVLDNDVSVSISADDWSIPSLTVTVRNTLGEQTNINAALLVFTPSGWRRFQSTAQTIAEGTATTPTTATFTRVGETTSDRIPLGQHWLLLFVDDGNTQPSASDAPLLNSTTTQGIGRAIDVYSRASATETLTIE